MKTLPNTPSRTGAPIPRLIAVAAAALLAAGCAGVPLPNPTLERAHASQTALQNDPQARQLAPSETLQAEEAVRTADAAWSRKEGTATVDHLAYLAQQRIAIARETVSAKTFEKTTQATLAGNAAERARTERNAAQRDLAAARQDTQAKSVELAVVSAAAQDDKARANDLRAQLRELNARPTERGDVVTLGDVLFDTNRAQLRSGAPGLGQLVAFLQRHPQRTVAIEGFTDSQGDAGSNLDLSQRRAGAVRDALIEQGVTGDRISIRGFGDAHPAASNATPAGRQMNRRVEIVLSPDGTTPTR
jgi:outer membrane protein OmpA-like peptidoglycan-associated protein